MWKLAEDLFALVGLKRQATILTLYDSKNRLLIYSISNGKRIGQLFGSNGSISPANRLLAVENKIGVITIYSLPSMEEVGKLVFAHPLAYVKFSKDGKHLFALTNDQSAYFFSTETVILKRAWRYSSRENQSGKFYRIIVPHLLRISYSEKKDFPKVCLASDVPDLSLNSNP